MTESITIERKPIAEQVGRYGLGIAITGALLILIDGIIVLLLNSIIAPSLGGALVVGSSEIVLSLVSLLALYYYRDHTTTVALTVGILAIISYLVDGGFFYMGATLELVGAVVIYFRK